MSGSSAITMKDMKEASTSERKPFVVGTMRNAWAAIATVNTTKQRKEMIDILAQVTGDIGQGLGVFGAAIGVGLTGLKAAEAVGRNPGASGKILVQSILGMALAEGLGILAIFVL